MKKCEYFRDLILTEYIDGRMAKDDAGQLETHLMDCAGCRSFFKEVKQEAVLPLQQAAPQPVPDELWAMVRQGIEEQQRITNPLADFIEGLKGILTFPRLVPVFASLVVMLVAGSVAVNTIQVHQAKDQEQGEYLISLLGPGTAAAAETNDGGSPIEHYFL